MTAERPVTVAAPRPPAPGPASGPTEVGLG